MKSRLVRFIRKPLNQKILILKNVLKTRVKKTFTTIKKTFTCNITNPWIVIEKALATLAVNYLSRLICTQRGKKIFDSSISNPPNEFVLNATRIWLSSFFATERGRAILYSSIPPNVLVFTTTDEGLFFIVNSSDKCIGQTIFSDRKAYDTVLLEESFKILNVDSPKSVLLDIGANIGTIGIYAVKKGYTSKCIAVEPDPNNFDLLKKNVSLNGLDKEFELHNLALSDNNSGRVMFELSPQNYGDHRVRVTDEQGLEDESSRKVIEVETTTLENIVKSEDLDDCVLFMDTQGFEGHILTGAESFIAMGVPIITEFWPYGLNRSGGLDKFITALSGEPYTKIYDLRNPSFLMDFSVLALKQIAQDLGDDGAFTELLITK